MGSRKKKRGKQKTPVKRKASPLRGSLFNVDSELHNAIQYHQSGHLKKAGRIYKKILKTNPNHPVCLNLMGIMAGEAGNAQMAVDLFSRAVRNDPGNPIYYSNLGNVLKDQGKLSETISCCQKALKLKPDLPEAYNNMGIALAGQSRLEEAMDCYKKALELKPDYAEAYYNMGNLFHKQDRLNDAISSCQKALKLKPDYAEAYYNMGSLLRSQGKLSEAIYCCQKALELKPDYAEAYYEMGASYQEWGKPNEAISCFQKILRLNPDFSEALVLLYDQFQQTCSWKDLESLTTDLDRFTKEAKDEGTRTPENPFISITRNSNMAQQFLIAKSWSSHTAQSISSFTNDFRYHAVALQIIDLFGLHDREKFDIFCYSYGKDDGSYCRERIQRDCDRFLDLRDLACVKAAERIYQDKVDILVDLTGHTRGNRLEICAFRPAPIQVSYLGFMGTTGADFFDYIITDSIVTPEEYTQFYSEQFVLMPHCFMINSNSQPISDKHWNKADFGLPEEGFVFCSFNSPYKLEAVMFDIWMKILKQVPDAILWMQQANQRCVRNLRREAETRGVRQQRLVFSESLPLEEHLSRLRLANLALDTRIYNGGATTNNALWAGIPVITLLGDHFTSRLSSSILKAIGLPELVTQSLEEYEALAVRLAHNPDELGTIWKKLSKNRLKAPLFDTSRFVVNLEKAYKEMWEIFLTGEDPRMIEVEED